MTEFKSLTALGWRPFFQQQLTLNEYNDCLPARIVEQHKSVITVTGEDFTMNIDLQRSMPDMVVGDWILLDSEKSFQRVLDRSTCFRRKAAGLTQEPQLIAANVDTAFIICSLNDDFNLNRIERYLSLVNESGAVPVVLLSKCDLSDSPGELIEKVRGLDKHLPVEAINCLDSSSLSVLQHWIKAGETIVVLGSSGVGKSTLVNTLLAVELQETGGTREADDKGRHTTTRRSLIPIPTGGLILDTPGMREIQLTDCREGIRTTFADIEELAGQCRFTDCQHLSEPGCAVRKALEAGALEQRRLDNYLKLLREEAVNSASLSEKRARDKSLGRFYKRTLSEVHKLKGR